MADKLTIGSTVVTKLQHGERRVDSAYRADTKAQVFPFAPPLPIIDLVDPSSALVAGGSTVTITGAYFSTTTAVRFGTTSAAFTIVNSTTVTATVPAGVEGSTSVTLTNITGTSNAYPFTYSSRPPAQRMVKSGSFSLPNFSYRDVTGWLADPAYPATLVVNDLGIAVKGGLPLVIEAVQLRNGTNGGSRLRITDTEGVEIALTTSASPITVAPFAYTPPIDTLIRTQGYTSSGIGGNPTIPDDPGTYLTITPT